MKREIYNLRLNSGIGLKNGGEGISLIKNLVCENGASVKRSGYKTIAYFESSLLESERINSIYAFEKNGEEQFFVHAGKSLYICSKDMSQRVRLALPQGASLEDKKSCVFLHSGRLIICGCGDMLVYDGEALSRFASINELYVPVSKSGICDLLSIPKESKKKSPNLLTSKRINTLFGTSTFTRYKKSPVFLLDERIKYGAPLEVNIKIRVKTSEVLVDEVTGEEIVDPYSSEYIGVDENGEEVSCIVKMKIKVPNIIENSIYFIDAPLVDELGREIKIKKPDGEVVDYRSLTWGIRARGANELSFTFDITSPSDEDNIEVFYESAEALDLAKIEIGYPCVSRDGEGVLAFTCGDNRLYYTKMVDGFYYLPKENIKMVGIAGEKITALCQMKGAYLGVFTKNAFYKLLIDSERSEAFPSLDVVGAENHFVVATVEGETLAFSCAGLFGTTDSQSYQIGTSSFYNRSEALKELTSGYTDKQREGAFAFAHEGRYYLFYDEGAIIVDCRYKYTTPRESTSHYGYELWLWEGCGARVGGSFYGQIYIGRDDGSLCVFDGEDTDREIKHFSEKELTVSRRDTESYTYVFLPKGEIKDGDTLVLNKHELRVCKGCFVEGQELFIPREEMYYDDGSLKIHPSERLSIYKGEELVYFGNDYSLALENGRVELPLDLENGEGYEIYLEKGELEYGCNTRGAIYYMGRQAKIKAVELSLRRVRTREIEWEIKSEPLLLGEACEKTIWGVCLTSKESHARVEIEAEGERKREKRELCLYPSVSFDSLNFGGVSFLDKMPRLHRVNMLLRGERYISVGLKSKDRLPLENIQIIYSKKGEK